MITVDKQTTSFYQDAIEAAVGEALRERTETDGAEHLGLCKFREGRGSDNPELELLRYQAREVAREICKGLNVLKKIPGSKVDYKVERCDVTGSIKTNIQDEHGNPLRIHIGSYVGPIGADQSNARMITVDMGGEHFRVNAAYQKDAYQQVLVFVARRAVLHTRYGALIP